MRTRAVVLLIALLVVLLRPAFGYFGLSSRHRLPSFLLSDDDDDDDDHDDVAADLLRRRLPSSSSSLMSLPDNLCASFNLAASQRSECARGTPVVSILVAAVRMSARVCRREFFFDRWNCSFSSSDSYRRRLLRREFRETAFLYAVTSASLAYAFSRACSSGVLTQCSCDDQTGQNHRETWLWGGCGDNVAYADKFVRRFLFSADKDKDEQQQQQQRRKGGDKASHDQRSQVNRHNAIAGIKAVGESVGVTCKCHGVSGSCTTKTCWQQLLTFDRVGHLLKDRYDHAVRVRHNRTAVNRPSGQRRLRRRKMAPPSQLVYLDRSPSFCSASKLSGGTGGRECSDASNCDSLCCKRGFAAQVRETTTACGCSFVWCCQVACGKCVHHERVNVCR